MKLIDRTHGKIVFEEGGAIRPNYITIGSNLEFQLYDNRGDSITLFTSDIFRLKMYLLYVVKDDKV